MSKDFQYDQAMKELENDLHQGRITQEQFKYYEEELNEEFGEYLKEY